MSDAPVEAALAQARDHARAGRRDDTLRSLLEAWRQQPVAELSALVEELGAAWRTPESPITRRGGRSAIDAFRAAAETAGPTALPWLLEELAEATSPSLLEARVVSLGVERRDPRVSTALVALVDALPHHGRMSRRLWICVFQEIERIGDPRGREALIRLLDEVRAHRREALRHTGRVVVEELATIVERVRDLPAPPPLSPQARALVDELREAGAARARSSSPSPVTEESLLAAVWAAPDDDGPRLVYADWLTERSDPRGELITLQCARAASGSGEAPSRRERALLKDLERALVGPLAPVALRAGLRFARGFLAAFRFKAQYVDCDKLIGHPAWATIEEVDANPHVFVSRPTDWLLHPAASSLRVVYGLRRDALDAIAEAGPVRWHTIGTRAYERIDEVLATLRRARDAGALPSLQTFDLSELNSPTPRALEPLLAHPALAGLGTVALLTPLDAVADAARLVATRPELPARLILRHTSWSREPPTGVELVIERGPPLTVAAWYRGATTAPLVDPLVDALAQIDPALSPRLTVDLAPTVRKLPEVQSALARLGSLS